MMGTIDYSNYNLEELHEAATSIDREKFPERASKLDQLIKDFTILTLERDHTWAESVDKTYQRNMKLFDFEMITSLFFLVFIVWRSVVIYFFDAHVWDVEEYFWPVYIIVLIVTIRRLKKEKTEAFEDYLKLSSGNIEFKSLGVLSKIDWSETIKVELEISKYSRCYRFYDDKPIKIMPLPKALIYENYQINEQDILRFIRARTTYLKIPFEEKTEAWRLLT